MYMDKASQLKALILPVRIETINIVQGQCNKIEKVLLANSIIDTLPHQKTRRQYQRWESFSPLLFIVGGG